MPGLEFKLKLALLAPDKLKLELQTALRHRDYDALGLLLLNAEIAARRASQ